MVCC